MKRTIILILLAAMGSSSCSDLLKENPKAIATETFYKNSGEIEAAVFAIYAPLQETVFDRNYLIINLSQVDYGVGRGSYASISQFQGLDATNIGRVRDLWTGFYKSIRNANIVIANAGTALANGVEEKKVNEFIAEARYMRAFDYFNLVINWGAVPLRTEETLSRIDLARAPVNEVYDFILQDLLFAETHLPEISPMAGRPGKWTAKTLLTDVLIHLERWSEARDLAGEIIDSGKYQLVEVSAPDDFYKIFGPEIATSSEDIFGIKYSTLKAGSFTVMLHHPGSPYNAGSGSYGVYSDSVSNKAIREWDVNDMRKQFNLYSFNIGFGPTTMLYRKFINPDATSGLNCDYPVYRYADLLLLFAEADCRVNKGPTAEGMEKLNMIRRRGYGYPHAAPSPVDFETSDYSEETFIDLLLKERMYEFFCEHKRFDDLKRTGRVKQAVKENHGLEVADKHLLWPIPNVEYNYNKAIDPVKDQNPGY